MLSLSRMRFTLVRYLFDERRSRVFNFTTFFSDISTITGIACQTFSALRTQKSNFFLQERQIVKLSFLHPAIYFNQSSYICSCNSSEAPKFLQKIAYLYTKRHISEFPVTSMQPNNIRKCSFPVILAFAFRPVKYSGICSNRLPPIFFLTHFQYAPLTQF